MAEETSTRKRGPQMELVDAKKAGELAGRFEAIAKTMRGIQDAILTDNAPVEFAISTGETGLDYHEDWTGRLLKKVEKLAKKIRKARKLHASAEDWPRARAVQDIMRKPAKGRK